MALDTDRYLDRRRLKRRVHLWRILAVIAVVALIALGIGRFSGLGHGHHVAVLDVSNVIFNDPRRLAALDAVAKNADVKALIVTINSPGGTVVGGETLFRSLRRVGDRKPVVAVLGALATSAGYMVAMGADHIIGRHSTVTGSIGVIMQTTDITGLLDKLGIKPEAIKSSPLKAQPNPLEPMTADARRAMQIVISDMYDMFVDMVVERRKLDQAAAVKLADGRIYTGRQAVRNGLIDALGGLPEARTWLADRKGIGKSLPARPLIIRRKENAVLEILEDLMGKALFSKRLRLDGLISLWHPNF